jgi:hypothetical protein
MFFTPFRPAESVREFSPEIDRCIGSPGPYLFQIEVRMKSDCAPENQIGLGKSVGIAEGSKADAFSGPGTEAFGFKQGSAKRQGILRL